jgi:hypothetical protein
LAFQLSWLRAGPVLLADYRDPPGTLPAIYEMLLKAGRPKVLAPSRTQLACHPDVLSYQSSIPRSSGAIDECLLAIGRGAQSAQDVMPGLKVGLESTLDEKDVLAPASGQYLANLRAQLREIDEPSNFKKLEIEGSARALSFLEDLLKKSS